jgi:hypothetical protein
MPGKVITNNIEDGSACALPVVHITDGVRKTRSLVQQVHRRPALQAAIPVGRTGAHALEKSEDRSDLWFCVERIQYRHLGRARIGQTYPYSRGNRSLYKDFSPIHCTLPFKQESTAVLLSSILIQSGLIFKQKEEKYRPGNQ